MESESIASIQRSHDGLQPQDEAKAVQTGEAKPVMLVQIAGLFFLPRARKLVLSTLMNSRHESAAQGISGLSLPAYMAF